MDKKQVRALLAGVKSGSVSIADALKRLSSLDVADLGFARIDHHRQLRRGLPEVVFAPGKTAEQLEKIVAHHAKQKASILVTRLGDEGSLLKERFPAGEWNELARTFTLKGQRKGRGKPSTPKRGLLIVTAGTSDLPVAAEAEVSARSFGLSVARLNDVGVAGPQRVLHEVETLRAAKVIIVVAGMEGALPSLVASLVEAPVIGVPTSAGYGAALDGFTALLGMLSSCAGGLVVVNIDNGFGAACAAYQMLNLP